MLRQVCTKPVVTISADAPISEAARLMHDKNIGTVVVVDGNRPRGILTDRDIAVAVAAEGRRPSTHVGEIMHANPAVIQEDQGIHDAVKMTGRRESPASAGAVADRAGRRRRAPLNLFSVLPALAASRPSPA